MSTQTLTNTLGSTALLISYLLISGCGGAESESTSQQSSEPATILTETIVASESFNFASEHELQISIVNPAGHKGAIHLYHGIDHQFSDGSVVADPMTRITSIDSNKTNLINLPLNKNIKQLIWHWTPSTSDELEQTAIIEIGSSRMYQIHL